MHETRLKPRDPEYEETVRRMFESAPFVSYVGYKLESVEPGRLESSLILRPEHRQQNNYVHAGVLGTMADHTAGGAAGTLAGPDEVILSVEYKINLLRPAVGERLRCVGEVLKNGRTIIVADSYVWTQAGKRERLVARATVTLAVVRGGLGG